jgi:acetylornithine deacetylase
MKMDIIKQVYDLCQTPSISGNESLVLYYLENELKKFQLTTEKIIVDEKRYNIFAYFKRLPKYTAILCTHVDTVGPYIQPNIDLKNEVIWGRGTCDAKGIAIAMIEAVKSQAHKGFSDLALLFTVGEEETSDGAKMANKVLAKRAHYLVIGEPTNLKSAYAQKGTIVFDLEAQGISAHSSMPNLGKSAIHTLANNVTKLINYSWPSSELYQETYLNVGTFNGGEARNVIASKANVKAIMRTSTKATELISTIESILSPDIKLKLLSKTDPFAYFSPLGFPSFLASFGSDAPYLTAVGVPILIGPGSLEVAHTSKEHITFSEILDGIKAYEKLATDLRKITYET